MTATTFSNDQECFTDYTGTDETVGTNTRPTATAINGYRVRAYAKIYRITGTAIDSNNVAKDIEIALVSRIIDNRLNGLRLSEELTEEEVTRLQLEFDSLPCGPTEPNQDASI